MERSINQQLREQSLCNHTRNPSSNKIQYHCYKCKLWQEDHLIQEVKFVPEGYISNRKSKKDQEFQRRINLNLKQFLSKFTAKQHPELQADMREKIIKIKKAGPYAKGSRECAAIVVYFAFQDQIRMTLREYCKQNNLNVKLFNKKLIAYNKLFRRDLPMKQVQSSSQHNYSNIKVQERPEQYVNLHDQQKYEKEPFIQLYPQYPQNINEKNIYKNLQNLHKAVQSIYDDVFKGFYFRNKKQVIVKKVADRINNVDSDRLKAHNFEEDQPINYFYLIFAILKCLSFKICFSRYSQIVNNKAGYTLSKARATEALKMYEEIQSQRIDESEKNNEIELLILERSEKDKEWERPMQQFQLVESGPMVLQEEYFSFQNCYYFLKSGSSDEIR